MVPGWTGSLTWEQHDPNYPLYGPLLNIEIIVGKVTSVGDSAAGFSARPPLSSREGMPIDRALTRGWTRSEGTAGGVFRVMRPLQRVTGAGSGS